MIKLFTITALSFLLGFIPLFTYAADLSFSNPADSYKEGSKFTVSVYVDSIDQAMNAVDGAVSFPVNTLEVVSISKVGSIFSLWAQEPSFSNSAGTVNFEGVVLNPGFIGSRGKILTITFRAKNVGQANLSFSSGSVLANDGEGTNILQGMRTTVINITAKPPTSSVPAKERDVSVTTDYRKEIAHDVGSYEEEKQAVTTPSKSSSNFMTYILNNLPIVVTLAIIAFIGNLMAWIVLWRRSPHNPSWRKRGD